MTARNGNPSGGRGRPHWLAKPLLIGIALALLAGVFAAYLSPHMVVDLANRVWACF